MEKVLKTVLLVLCFLGSAGVRQAMAQQTDTFMFVQGIRGASTDPSHRNWIDVFSLTQTLETTSNTGGTSNGQCRLEVIKGLDIAGPLLWGAAVTGRRFENIRIDVRNQGTQAIFYKILMRGAHFTSISTIGNGGYVERLTLDAEDVQLIFFPQNPDGTPGPAVTSSFSC